MSYENNSCPCGGNKQPQTMICQECRDHLAGNRDLAAIDDITQSIESRRTSAIRILSLSRKRKKLPSLPLCYEV